MSSETAEPKLVRPRVKLAQILPTERIAFQRQLDILRAYAINGENGRPVSNDQIASTVNIAASTATLVNAFFSDIQLIQRAESGYVPSPETIAFNRAYEWDADTAARKLGPALTKTWFAAALIPKLRFRPLDEKEVLAMLGEESAAGKDHEPQLRMLLDYLAAAGLIARDNGMVRIGQNLGGDFANTPPNPIPQKEQGVPRSETSDLVLPIPLGRGRLAKVELPKDWDSNKDLERFLKILRLSLSEDAEEAK